MYISIEAERVERACFCACVCVDGCDSSKSHSSLLCAIVRFGFFSVKDSLQNIRHVALAHIFCFNAEKWERGGKRKRNREKENNGTGRGLD